jgi:deoxycytidylate deaminase
METKNITYPYLPEGKTILYTGIDNVYMQMAKNFARENSLDKAMPNGTILVKNGEVIGRGANGSDYHDTHECERVKLKMPTGAGYELCEGCHPKNHGEPKALADAKKNNKDPKGADAYLWGHWWCCEPCWNSMIEAGIKNVYLLEGSEKLFNRNSPENVIGHQFE